jgi:hypothetical protein
VKTFRVLPVLFFLAMTAAAAYAAPVKLEGRILEQANRGGIPGLTVKLIPPTAGRRSENITLTDRNGAFRFAALEPGKYLLEVYQGLTLLHREILVLEKDLAKEIELKRR